MMLRKVEEKSLTIIKSGLLRVDAGAWLQPQLVFQRVQGKALEIALEAADSMGQPRAARRALLLFDCLLRVAQEPVIASPVAFASPRFRRLQKLFYGAMGSDQFIDSAPATKFHWAIDFRNWIDAISIQIPVRKLDYRPTDKNRIPAEYIIAFESIKPDAGEIEKLHPFLLRSKNGRPYRVMLEPLRDTLGSGFAKKFHEGLCELARAKAKDTALRDFGTTFANYIEKRKSENLAISVAHLLDPLFVDTFLVDFMEFHFTKMVRRRLDVQEGTLPSLQKLWSRYKGYWEAMAKGGVLANPNAAFPAGNPGLLSGTSVLHRRTVVDEHGQSKVATHKLIVPLPLHLSVCVRRSRLDGPEGIRSKLRTASDAGADRRCGGRAG